MRDSKIRDAAVLLNARELLMSMALPEATDPDNREYGLTLAVHGLPEYGVEIPWPESVAIIEYAIANISDRLVLLGVEMDEDQQEAETP